MGRLLGSKSGAIKFHANQKQKDSVAQKLAAELLAPDSAFIVPENDTAIAIATDAVNEACETAYVACNEQPEQQIYLRALKVMKSWAGDMDESPEAEIAESNNIALLEGVQEKLTDCLHVALVGSPKQIAWAEVLRLQKMVDIAIEVVEKRLSLEEAAKILSTSSAKWFIENR